MDIPLVLEKMAKDGVIPWEWGSCASSNCTYEQFSARWPHKDISCPTKEKMLVIWSQIERVPKTRTELETEVNNYLQAGILDPNEKIRELLSKLVADWLLQNPSRLKDVGILIDGEKSP